MRFDCTLFCVWLRFLKTRNVRYTLLLTRLDNLLLRGYFILWQIARYRFKLHVICLYLLCPLIVKGCLLLIMQFLKFLQLTLLSFTLACFFSSLKLKSNAFDIGVLNASFSILLNNLFIVISFRFLTEEYIVEHLVIVHTLLILQPLCALFLLIMQPFLLSCIL